MSNHEDIIATATQNRTAIMVETSTNTERYMPFSMVLTSYERFKAFTAQVFNGNPVDMAIQAVVGIIGGILSVWVKVSPFVGAYIFIVAMDTFLGVRLSKRKGRPFSWSHLLWGPGQKIVFTAAIMVAGGFMDRFVPGELIAQSISGYMSAVLFLEAVGKYDKLTGNHILDGVRERLSGIFSPAKPTPPPAPPVEPEPANPPDPNYS